MTNIWHSIESEGWSRGFGYEVYKILCKENGLAPQKESFYKALCELFEKVMEEEIGECEGVDNFTVEAG